MAVPDIWSRYTSNSDQPDNLEDENLKRAGTHTIRAQVVGKMNRCHFLVRDSVSSQESCSMKMVSMLKSELEA